MTERELIQQQQELGDSRFLVTRSGKFFSAYGCGAFALARATGYRVMHRQRKGGNFVLTTGFPESHVGKVMEQIIAAGGKIDRQDDGSFVFSGIDGSEAEALVSIPEKTEGGQDLVRPLSLHPYGCHELYRPAAKEDLRYRCLI